MTRTQKFTLSLAMVAVLGIGSAFGAVAEIHKLVARFYDGIILSKTATTNTLKSDTSAATMTSSVAAITLSPTATPAANDLVFEVNDAAGLSLFSVDVEGDLTMAGSATFAPADLTLTGGDLTSSHATQSFNHVSATDDATCSTTVAAHTISASVDITAGDLVLAVRDSAAAALFTVNEQGLCTAATDVAAAGNNFMCTGTGTCQIDSAAADATTSATVGAFTLKPSVNIANADLVFDVQDSAGGHAFTVTEAGAAAALTGMNVGAGTTLLKITSEQVDNQDIGSAAAATTTVLAVNVAGATLGDSVICQSVQDDAAWDECSLSCFVESSGVVKLVIHADATGCDPAAGNDYRFTILRF